MIAAPLGLIALGLWPASAATGAAPAGGEPIVLHERAPIAFLLTTPTGAAGSISSSEIIRVVSALFDRHTSLSVSLVDPTLVADCRGRLGCFVKKVRTEYGHSGGAPRLLLVLTNLTQPKAADRWSVLLLDAERAHAIMAEAPKSRSEELERDVEARIGEGAVLVKPKWTLVKDEAEARAFLERVFLSDLRRALEDMKVWDPYGEIAIELRTPGVAIELDGTAIGATQAGTTRIMGVMPGRRALRLVPPRAQPYTTEVAVEPRSRIVVRPVLEREEAASSATILRRGLAWGGAGVAAAGIAVAALAVLHQNGDVQTYCAGPRCSSGRAFLTAGYDPSATPTFEDRVNPRGVLLAPLGFSLFAAGGTWAGTTPLFDRDADAPWLELLLGVAAGAATYGVSAALNGRSAFH